jgi:signal transduction histidine kinase/DNA-binding response OmpR family regulator
MPDGRAAILIVDDRPEKVLALEAVLEDLGETIVRAYSGREALRHVLDQEFAVILLDINMPGMDGFETAALIRQRKSSEHVPIIFITAFGDEMHAARGYSLGAVDYILAPVVPDVLRTKVMVFVDLYKKSEQLKRQAEFLRQRAGQLHKLTAASLAINSALSVEKMLQVVTDTAREIIGAHQAGTVAVLGPARNRPTRVSSFSHKFPDASECCRSLEGTDAYRQVVEENRPVRMTQVELERLRGWHETAPVPAVAGVPVPGKAPRMRGWVAAPLTGRDGRNMGLIQLSDRFEGDFTHDDEAILVQLAQMASIAIENSLYSEEREANRVKDEFLATLSHELRTPLNAILGWTQLLKMEGAGGEVGHGLDVIERNARSQAKLIEDLLDVSRITTGKLRLNMRQTELGPAVQAAADAVRPTVEAKQIEIDCRLDAADSVVHGDPDRLQQVFWNLFANAAKFTPAGGKITVRLDYTPAGDAVRMRVTDTGAGIEPKFLPYVFDRFRQADSSSTRSHGGLGIGLTIVRHIVEQHGGSVYAESPGEGLGATFTVLLPLAKADAGRAGAPSAAPVRLPSRAGGEQDGLPNLYGVRVLIVDDEPDAREVIGQILRRCGADTAAAGSTREALAVLGRERPDVLLSDIAMPDEDGYELIRQVRALPPEEGGGLPAVALTAYARDEDRQIAIAAGFQAHLVKPVEPIVLASAVAGLAPKAPERRPAAKLRLA